MQLKQIAHWSALLLVACGVGVLGGMFGLGGGVILVPLLVLVFAFDQHRAQGTTLVALVPPTGLLGLLNYAHAREVDWIFGLLLMPGVFFGAFYGSWIAQKLTPDRMRRAFAALLFAVGAAQLLAAVWK
ncbi:MAG: sulfite exporter TauE/SafE family protein [Candidatus Acidiferrales bacterium]